LNKLNQLNSNFVSAEMVKAFIQSTEYIDEDLVHNGAKLALSKTDSRAELKGPWTA